MKTLKDLLLNELSDIYDAEKRLARALPKMEKSAANEQLKIVLHHYGKVIIGRPIKLAAIFKSFGAKAKGRACDATIGLLKEATEILSDFEGSPAIDAAIISTAQKISHYKIASFGCLSEWSDVLDNNPAAIDFMDLLDEEKKFNEGLTDHARASSNELALGVVAVSEPADDES